MANFFNFFGRKPKNPNPHDPYWDFEEQNHYRPLLNKGDYYKLNGYDFGWFVLESLSKFVKDKEHEIERAKSFSFGQKALYYWWYLDGQVTNGGFVQFYYNGYGPYIPTIIKGLEHIGDTEMVALVQKADSIYQKNRKLMDKARKKDLFGSDLYDRLDGLSLLDSKYYHLNEKTMSLIEAYIRKNPSEICLDEDGKEFDLSFSGPTKTYYDNQSIKEEYFLDKGVIHGKFKLFYSNGHPKEKIQYNKGIRTGEKEEFYDSGILKHQVVKDPTGKLFIYKKFYENGNVKKLETKLIGKNEKFGPYKEWHKTGQLSKSGNYISKYKRGGKWLEFYPDGSRKVEAEFIDGIFKLNNHWSEEGEHTLIDGTGLYVYTYSRASNRVNLNKQEYKNYKRHGKQEMFTNGILTLYQEMAEGKEHGYTRRYYNNGNIREEICYENGNSISTKKFPKFKKAVVKTSIIAKLCVQCYRNQEEHLLPDNIPNAKNAVELAEKFKAKTSIFDGYNNDDYVMNYSYIVYVGKNGEVIDLRFTSSSNALIKNQVEANLEKMTFEIALKNEKPIKSIHFVQHQFVLAEKL